MTTDLQLSPCPFCGRDDTAKLSTCNEYHDLDCECQSYGGHGTHWNVVCDAAKPDGPGGCGGSSGFMPTQAGAITAWNRRFYVLEVQP